MPFDPNEHFVFRHVCPLEDFPEFLPDEKYYFWGTDGWTCGPYETLDEAQEAFRVYFGGEQDNAK